MAIAHRSQKHNSVLHKDRVTIIMVASEDYTSFPKAIDRLYEHTDYPFDLIVVEGQAPHAVQMALEKRVKLYKNMRILYTHHAPLLSEAYNVALAHARTPLVFFTDNRLIAEKGWLAEIVRTQKLYNCDILAPQITDAEAEPIPAMTGHSFLATRSSLTLLGEFDDNVQSYYFTLDLSLRAKSKEVDIRFDEAGSIKRDCSLPTKSADQKLFDRQWAPQFAHNTASYLSQKWGVELDPSEAPRWLENRVKGGRGAFWGSVRGSLAHLNSSLNYAKLGLTRLMHSLIQI